MPNLDTLPFSPLRYWFSHTAFFTMIDFVLQSQNSNEVSSADLEKNETFLDEIFLQGKYAQLQDTHFNYLQGISETEFVSWKAYLAGIENNKKIEFFTQQLFNERISLRYFKTQTWRYQVKKLKKYCLFTVSKNLSSVQNIDQLPLPKLLKEDLEQFAEQQANNIPRMVSP